SPPDYADYAYIQISARIGPPPRPKPVTPPEEKSPMLKSLVAVLVVLVCIASASGPASSQAPGQRPELSGTLNLLCTPQLAWCEGMKAEFQKVYPKVTVEFVRLSSGEALTRLRNEKANPQFDIWWGGPIDSFIAAKAEGLLEAYNSPNLANLIDPRFMKDPDNYWAGIYVGSLGFASNKNFLAKAPAKPPESVGRLPHSRLKGPTGHGPSRQFGHSLYRTHHGAAAQR